MTSVVRPISSTFRRSPCRLRHLAALLTALSVMQGALALPEDAPHQFRIERAPLEHVLMEITRLSGHPLSFASNLVKERVAGPIKGTMTAAQAARAALQDSGLALAILPDGTLTVVASDTTGSTRTDAQPRNIGTLPQTEVHANADQGFAVFSTSAITRVEMPMTSMPNAVNTITNGLLTSLRPPSLAAALAQTGVTSVLTDPTAPPLYAIRGFMTDTISVDGLPDKLASLRPMEAVEDINVIKGPNADVAGVTMAGGAINANLKAPTKTTQRSVTVEVGSHAERKVVADLAGAIGPNGLSYRVVALNDTTANSDGGYAGHRVSYGHAALGWSNSATDITVGAETLSSRQPIQPATFALNGAPARIPAQTPLGNADDRVQGNGTRVYYTLSHNLSDDWAVHSRASYESVSEESVQWHLGPAPGNTVPNTMWGLGYRTDSHLWALSNEFTGALSQGPLRHTFTLGWDELHERQDLLTPGGYSQATQDPFAPVPLPAAVFIPGIRLSQTVRQSIFRLRDRIAIGERWEVSASIRANDYVAKLPHAQLQGLAWTPAAGVLYKLTPHTAWFADYSRGFQINTGYFYNGSAMQPERSRQLETGLRWENTAHTLTAQAALYRINANNVSLADVSHPGYYTQITNQTSEGMELSVQGTLAPGWETALWLALSRVSGTLPGGFLPRAPTRGGSLWTTYTVQGGALAGVGAGIGVNAQSGIDAYGETPFRLPGAVRVDSSLFWHQKRWRIDVFARNLFNIRAYGNTLTSNFIPILPGRTLALRVTHNF
ncbi:Metal-pseudopaline receptor CntO [Ralstonia psammae]|uniref:Metal-pseudopaline receptor CntO n=1 Tax=Ralstonia psammae TaxID=3058598 RepID=A0ABM9JRQ2_9RALS|nr:TonB-dependent receptor [Ralstonia sp. LMG 19083]CAJ0802076.1 Metal-pseudopaline receptor CntO [Ralstonia sp. LMG 19083]